MATYTALRTKFIARMNRRDLTTTLADGFIQDAIRRVQRVARIPLMEASLTVTLDSTNYGTDGVLNLPGNYIMMRTVTVNDEFVLIRKPLDYVLQTVVAAGEGKPLYYARRGGGLIFAPYPTLSAYEIRLDYYSDFAEFDSTDDAEIEIATVAEDLIVYGALSYAADHWNDKRRPLFEERFTQILSDLQAQADVDELTDAAVSQAFAYPSDD